MKNVVEQNSNVVGDAFWFGNPKIRYALVNGRVWQEGDRPYDSCRVDADGVTFGWREEPR